MGSRCIGGKGWRLKARSPFDNPRRAPMFPSITCVVKRCGRRHGRRGHGPGDATHRRRPSQTGSDVRRRGEQSGRGGDAALGGRDGTTSGGTTVGGKAATESLRPVGGAGKGHRGRILGGGAKV
jgi:hypothetical protein